MIFSPVPVWKEAPFLRLLVAFSGGILVQWHFDMRVLSACVGLGASFSGLCIFTFKNITSQFRRYWMYGVLLNCLFFFTGVLFTWKQDGSNNPIWISKFYSNNAIVLATLEEPLSEKPKSFKALASVQAIQIKDSLRPVSGKILIYFQKDSLIKSLKYGSRIVFSKPLQPIKNTGNPGSFDYSQHCHFQQIYYQVYLKQTDYKVLPGKKINWLKQFVISTRMNIISILRNNIPGARECGLAEALLIGYKDDLDKKLVQSYSNTGVVHVIAISGLHVGLVYWLLTNLLIPFSKLKKLAMLKPVLAIAGIWIFSLLAGASPSVLRSAVMFTCIVCGESVSRKISVYNSLAASAFLLLCFNPFWLWDVGFQLSYAAVLSIVVFMKPIYNWFFIQNKIVDTIWKMNAVTLSAQILTMPLTLYYFHQFPILFLITNFIAVPLSGVILVGEILLCVVSFIPVISDFLGRLIHWIIRMMNWFIESIDKLPVSVLGNIQISLFQSLVLYATISTVAIGLLHKRTAAMVAGLAGILLFVIGGAITKIRSSGQIKMIVYNIPNCQAIDFIQGKNYLFKGDSVLLKDDFLHQFHLKPSRSAHQVTPKATLPTYLHNEHCLQFNARNIVVIESPLPKVVSRKKISVEIIIISKNPKVTIRDLDNIFTWKKIIFDASNSIRNIAKWKSDCDKLGIPCYSIPEKGAFVMNMN